DVEGAEMDFLTGAENLVTIVRPKILLSAHGYKKNNKCLTWLQDKDYTTHHLVANTEQGDYVIFAIPKN
ncbi:MAG: FkbM family methyltransferase, partial [Gammaproteobacteria bacterium]|nr:FkbM family methyltransferase [Gammaproteobacteria bacterium]